MINRLRKFKYEIKVPKDIQIEWFKDKVRFIGTQQGLYNFIAEFSKLKELNDGDLVKLDRLTLKLSDYISEDREKTNFIELPNHAWAVMSGKFYDVWEQRDSNPFDFNDCGYTDINPFDIGIEITDIPLTDSLLVEKPHVRLFKNDSGQLYLRIDDTELFDYIEDYLIERKNITIENCIDSCIGKLKRYILFFNQELEPNVIKAVKELDANVIEMIFKLNNKKNWP